MVVYDHIASNIAKTWFWMAAFFLVILGLGWLFSQTYDAPGILIGAVLFSTIGSLVSYWFSDSIALGLAGAKEITSKRDFPEFWRVAENLSIAAGLPMPRLFVIDEAMPNAFATGRDPKHAAVAVTRGLMERLDKDELQGVLAHELSHVGNRDTLLMTAVVILAGVVSVLADLFLRLRWFGFRRRSEDEGNSGQGILLLVGIVFAILAPLGALLIQLAISRKREFLADANAVLITRYPDGLISALRKISASPSIAPDTSTAIQHLYFSNPFGADRAKKQENTGEAPWYATLFSTHPSIQQRISALEKMKE